MNGKYNLIVSYQFSHPELKEGVCLTLIITYVETALMWLRRYC